MFWKVLFIVPYLMSHCKAAKWLIENPGFNDPQAWLSEYLPCSLENVVFPADYNALLPLPKEVDVSGFVLPRDGAILLHEDATINLGGELRKGRACENGRSRRAELRQPRTSRWYNPQSWRSDDTRTARNPAVPHMELVPCSNDTVIMPAKGAISLDLDNVRFLRLGQLSLAGAIISKSFLQQFLLTDLGQLMFQNSISTAVQYYRSDNCGCLNVDQFVDAVCNNLLAKCPRRHCLQPVSAYESCCPICGSVLRFTVDTCTAPKLDKLRQHLSKAIKQQKLDEDLSYYVSYLRTSAGATFLQAIVVDREDYNERSVRFMRSLNETTDWSKLLGSTRRLQVQLAGRPYNPNVSFASILLIFLCLLFVGFVALVIFAQYAPNNRYLHRVPAWLHDPRQWRALLRRSHIMFARFDDHPDGGRRERAAGAVGTDAGDGGDTMRESIIMGYDAESGELLRRGKRAFDNPLFMEASSSSAAATAAAATGDDAARSATTGKGQVGKASDKQSTVATLVDTTPTSHPAKGVPAEEQELKEIILANASSSEDDDNNTASSEDEGDTASAFLDLDGHELKATKK